MIRALLILSLGFFASASLAQHTIEGFPNPYDGETDEYLVLRNTGSEPVLLDSLAFAGILNALPDNTDFARYFWYEAFLGGKEFTGQVICYYFEPEPSETLCRDWSGVDPPPFFNQYLTSTDSLKLSYFREYCTACLQEYPTFDDTLLVFADGIETPVEVEIINGQIVESEEGAPLQGVNLSVHPNPSPGGVAVILALETPAHVTVSISDIRGRTVAILVDGALSSGEHTFLWDHSGVAPGVYIVQAYTGEAVLSKNVTVVR